MFKSNISVYGYDLLGENGKDGIRYAWKYNDKKQLLESAAFPNHRKNTSDNVCGYTTSVSMGCILKALNMQCSFCRTGNKLSYYDSLSAIDIAKQNIFMVLSDIYCSNHKSLINMPKEFAYMGQGEPGYSYTQLREAIKITDIAMKKIGQVVYRHIISTAGVPEMISAFKDDLRNGFYNEKVTLHFSLHSVMKREIIMPIEKKYSFMEVLDCMENVVDLSGEKPCIGILLFKEYHPYGKNVVYSNELQEIKDILKYINSNKFRLSFCEFNDSVDVGTSTTYENEMALSILKYARNIGFEAKLFSSFGKNEMTACGMLGSKLPESYIGEKWHAIEQETNEIINEIVKKIRRK